MAGSDKKITQLTNAGSVNGNELIEIVQGGVSKKTLLSVVATYISSALTFNYIDFIVQLIAPTYSEGRVWYDDNKKALSYYNEESDVSVNMGQELLIRVYNDSGATITNGSVVYPSGVDATSELATIGLADAKVKSKCRLVGMATHDIENNSIGYVTRIGSVSDLNTTGLSGVVYLSATTPGAYTMTTPDDGAYIIAVGAVGITHATEGTIIVDPTISELTVEVTDTNGFPDDQKTATTITKIDGTRTFTIAPTGSEFHFYELGDKYEKTSSENVVWTDVEGEHWFYYNEGVLTAFPNPTGSEKAHLILNHALVGFIYWNAVDNKSEVDLFEERHSIGMSPQTHLYLHLTQGAKYHSGLAVGNVLAEENGSLITHAQFSVSAGTFFDEDLTLSPTAFSVGDTMQVVYNLGAGVLMRSDTQTNLAVLNASSGRLYYNQNNAGTWQLTEVPNSDFVLYHIFAINGVSVGFVSVMGQNYYGNVGNARAGASSEITSLLSQLPFAEMIPLATIIYQTRDTYSNSVKARIRSTDTGEDYIDWRVTELSQGTPASNHLNLTNLQLAGTGVTWGHVDNSTPLQLPERTTTEEGTDTHDNGQLWYNTTLGRFGAWIGGALQKVLLINDQAQTLLGEKDFSSNVTVRKSDPAILFEDTGTATIGTISRSSSTALDFITSINTRPFNFKENANILFTISGLGVISIGVTPTTDTSNYPVLTRNSSTGAIEQRTLVTQTSIASSATPAPTGDSKENEYYLTALAANATFAAPTGTPANGNTLLIRIEDNGTARTLAWNTIYESVATLPTTTTISKKMYIGFIYNSTDSKWDCVSVVEES